MSTATAPGLTGDPAVYRYFMRLGFWYRFLVDVKAHELETLMRKEELALEESVRREFGLEI